MQVTKYRDSRFFAVYDTAGELVVVTVYKRGAQEVVRRLTQSPPSPPLTAIGSTQESRGDLSARENHPDFSQGKAAKGASAKVAAPSVLSPPTSNRKKKVGSYGSEC